MKRVIVPARNEKDLQEVPADLRAKIKVEFVDRIDEVWPLACDTADRAKPKAKAAKGKKAKVTAPATA